VKVSALDGMQIRALLEGERDINEKKAVTTTLTGRLQDFASPSQIARAKMTGTDSLRGTHEILH